jgi:hypothetical protein
MMIDADIGVRGICLDVARRLRFAFALRLDDRDSHGHGWTWVELRDGSLRTRSGGHSYIR